MDAFWEGWVGLMNDFTQDRRLVALRSHADPVSQHQDAALLCFCSDFQRTLPFQIRKGAARSIIFLFCFFARAVDRRLSKAGA